MPTSGFVLEESVGFLLSQVARAIARDLQSRLSPYGVTPPQLCVLTCLWEEDGLSLTLLAERAGFDAPTITGILDRLERQELVARHRKEDDRRVIAAQLTERGWALQDALPRLAAEGESAALAGVPPEDVVRLRATLRRVVANLEA